METEHIISLSAVVIALAALGVSIWASFVAMRHQKLSVKPHIAIDFDHRITHDLGVYIRSNGLGPAKIVDYKWHINGKQFPIRTRQDFLDVMNVLGLGDLDTEFFAPSIGNYIEPGYQSFLLRFRESANTGFHPEVCDRLLGTKVIVTYESIYGESQTDIHENGRA